MTFLVSLSYCLLFIISHIISTEAHSSHFMYYFFKYFAISQPEFVQNGQCKLLIKNKDFVVYICLFLTDWFTPLCYSILATATLDCILLFCAILYTHFTHIIQYIPIPPPLYMLYTPLYSITVWVCISPLIYLHFLAHRV